MMFPMRMFRWQLVWLLPHKTHTWACLSAVQAALQAAQEETAAATAEAAEARAHAEALGSMMQARGRTLLGLLCGMGHTLTVAFQLYQLLQKQPLQQRQQAACRM